MPPVTAFYFSLLLIFYVFLTLNVVRYRRTEKVGIGFGDSKELRRAIRVHSNFVEYVPMAIIMLYFIEISAYPRIIVHILGSVLCVARVLHFQGLSKSPGTSIGRFWGTTLTVLVLLVSALMTLTSYLAG